jgi:hypothetical protein
VDGDMLAAVDAPNEKIERPEVRERAIAGCC